MEKLELSGYRMSLKGHLAPDKQQKSKTQYFQEASVAEYKRLGPTVLLATNFYAVSIGPCFKTQLRVSSFLIHLVVLQ